MDALDLQIDVGAAGPDGYQVTARAPDGSETAGLLRLPLPAAEFDSVLSRVRFAILASSATARRAPTDDEQPVRELGGLLFEALLADQIRALLVSTRLQASGQGRRLRLVLRIRPPELARLPWEFLFDGSDDDYLCLNTPLIRHPTVLEPHRPVRVEPPLRVLGMTARPGDHDLLDADGEQRRLQAALADLQRRGLVELSWVPGSTWRDLQDTMRRGPWHIFHFIGHGGFDAVAGEGTLMLSGDDGRAYPLHGSSAAMLLRGHPSLRLVVLNACRTGQASSFDPFSSVAGSLMRRGIPAVLAMQFEITDRAAIECSRAFYGAIADRLPVDMAVTEARQAIRLAMPNTLEWGTPVLYLRSPDGNVFDLAEAVSPAAPRRGAPAAAGIHHPVELSNLYTEGLAAFHTERWADAVAIFRDITARDHGYRDAVERLDSARRQEQLAGYYAVAVGAEAEGDWAAAVEHLEALLAVEPGYRDCRARLTDARRRLTATRLRDEASELFSAGKWEAVLAVSARLAEVDPDGPGIEHMVDRAREQLAGASAGRTRLLARLASGLEVLRRAKAEAATAKAEAAAAKASGPPRFLDKPTRIAYIDAKATVNAVAFSPDGRTLAIACDDYKCRIVDPVTGAERLLLDHGGWPARVWSVAFDPGGTRLATGGFDNYLRIWDLSSGKVLATRNASTGIRGVAFSPNGRLVATATSDRKVRIWDWSEGKMVVGMRHDGLIAHAWTVAFHPAGNRVASGGGDQTARIWDARTGKQLAKVTHGSTVFSVAFSPDGRLLATASADGSAQVVDSRTGDLRLRIGKASAGAPAMQAVAFGPDGRSLMTGGPSGGQIWDTTSGGQLMHLPGGGATCVAVCGDGTRVAIGNTHNGVEVWLVREASS